MHFKDITKSVPFIVPNNLDLGYTLKDMKLYDEQAPA